MASSTTNLALYKKNPTTDGTDTFNITTMLNDNWDKIDAAVAQPNKITAKSASATLTSLDQGIVEITTGASVITITLPSAVTSGLRYTIKKIDSGTGTVTIATTSGQTIDGATTKVINARYASATVVSNGASWNVVTDGVLKPWGDNTRDTRSAFFAYQTGGSGQSFSAATVTKVNFSNAALYDNKSEYDLGTSSFLAKDNGNYLVCANLRISSMPSGSNAYMSIYINGAEAVRVYQIYAGATTSFQMPVSQFMRLNAGDTVSIYFYCSNPVTADPSIVAYQHFGITRIS
jgi:hypothetical protein